MAEAGTKPEKKRNQELCQMAKGLWVMEKSGHREGEIRLQNRQTSSMYDSEVKGMRLPCKSGWVTPAAAPTPHRAQGPSLT